MKSLWILFLLVFIGCGSVSIAIDTEVKDAEDISHNIRMEAEGQIVSIMEAEGGMTPDNEEMMKYCSETKGLDTYSLVCEGVPHSVMLADDDEDSIQFDVQRTDLGRRLGVQGDRREHCERRGLWGS